MKGAKPQMRTASNAVKKAPAAPSWLSKDGRAEWSRVIPALVERRILTDADMGALENYCLATGRVRELERAIQKNGVDPILSLARQGDGHRPPVGGRAWSDSCF